ncbi:MAG TPA: guanine permease [Lentisphaeria bacterium]|nr:MAG: guanine permease [Lentisphaerae bacterium GWF2_38_69]HBM15587.1 guanine permease [Lentisphaeria bacterium]
METIFCLQQRKTNIKTEVLAGATTFMAMAYILAVNPIILANAGMDPKAVFVATAVAAAVATAIMGILANLPVGLAPGMGENAFFAFTIVITMGYSWQFALTAVLLSGIILLILSIAGTREVIINKFPKVLKNAIASGIGLLIIFIGLFNSGVIKVSETGAPVSLGNFDKPFMVLAFIGIFITAIALHKRIPGGLIVSIIIVSVLAVPFGITQIPSSIVSLPPSISSTFMKFDFTQIFTFNMLVVVLVTLFMGLFDTMGTLIGVTTKAKLIDNKGKIPNLKKSFLSDSIGSIVAACFGTSLITAYVESSAGIAEGGKTGLTSVTTALLFIISLFLSPIFLAIPAVAVAPIMVCVGILMLEPVKEINYEDLTDAIPFAITLIFTALSYSIADGIALGTISFTLLKLFTGKKKEINLLVIILTIIFVIKFLGYNYII